MSPRQGDNGAKLGKLVTPRTGNSHEVGGEFPNDHLHLLMGRFPKDSCESGVWHLCLDLSADTVSDMFDVLLS